MRREGGVKTFALEAPGKAVSTAESQEPSQSGRIVPTVPSEIRWVEFNDDPLCQLLLEKFALSILGLPHEAWQKIQAERRVKAPDAPTEAQEPEDELVKSGEVRGSSNFGRDPL